jgi:predicted nucleic acid-binding protein
MLCFDSSALVKCYQEEKHSPWVREVMEGDPEWCGSALLAAEVPIALGRSVPDADDLHVAGARISRDLGFFYLVAVDADCLVRAVDTGRVHGLRTLDAIHLAAARILPSDARFVTFDDRQREAAESLGLRVLAPPV